MDLGPSGAIVTTRRSNDKPRPKIDTLLAHAGREPQSQRGAVNPPVYHASTIVFPTLEAYRDSERNPFEGITYGRAGTPTTCNLQDAVAALEGGWRSIAVPSGLSAITTSLLAFLRSGDHLLMVDSVYGPTRRFCERYLKGFGVAVTYYDPVGDIRPLLRPETRVVFLESPGSLTFEVQDVAATTAAAREAGAVSILDNTWSAGVYFKPFDHGVDVSLQAATKYIVGHSDALLGLITTTEETFLPVRRAMGCLGTSVGPDDCYLGLRGLRTLRARLDRHFQTAQRIAEFLAERPQVTAVLYPALPAFGGHDLWKRDFSGANGLVSFVLEPGLETGLAAMLEGMRLFAMGASWGGYESLILPADPARSRSATTWRHRGQLLRIHCGLEDVDDLIEDLTDGLDRLTATA